jgi:hypothetical protein
MRRRELMLVIAYIGTFAFQVLWHWFLSGHSTLAQSLLRFYLYHDPRPWRDVEGYLDLLLPAILLGLLTGWVGWRWSMRKLCCYVLSAGVGIVAIMPVYTLFLDKSLFWFWPETVGGFMAQVIKAWPVTGMLTYAGRVFGVYFYAEKGPRG